MSESPYHPWFYPHAQQIVEVIDQHGKWVDQIHDPQFRRCHISREGLEAILKITPEVADYEVDMIPTAEHLLEIAKPFSSAWFEGWIVLPPRVDSVFALEGIHLPWKEVKKQHLLDYITLGPDEVSVFEDEGTKLLRLWWD